MKEPQLQVLNYKEATITFEQRNANVMANATEMARTYGKQVSEWLRLPSTKTFIEALKETKGFSHSLIITKEGRNGGTWMHQDLAIELARWLEPKFAIRCNDFILEHFYGKKQQADHTSHHIASAKEVRAHYAAIEAKKALLNLNEASVASMVNKTDEALGIKGQYIEYVPSKGVVKSLTALLKEFNVPISAQQANKILQERGIIKQMSRKSSRGEKHFWSIADSNYGENQVNPNNPKETHPMFYQNKFGELIPFLSNNLLAV